MRLYQAFKIIIVPTQKKLPQKYLDGTICFLINKQVHWGQSEKQHSNPSFNIICCVIVQKKIEIVVLENI